MKKLMLALSLAVTLFSMGAKAEDSPTWVCQLAFTGQAQGFQVFVGKFVIDGKGDLNCVGAHGDKLKVPLNLNFVAAPLAFKIAFGKFNVYGEAAQINLFNREPKDIIGSYAVAQAQAVIIGGIGAITAVHAHLPDLSLVFSLQFAKGFGLNVGVSELQISVDESRLAME